MSLVARSAISPAFATEVSRSHRLAVTVQALDGTSGEVLADFDSVLSGSVTLDGSAAIRARCDLELVDSGGDVLPVLASDPLAPYGNELKIARGVTYPDGSTEEVELGVFRLRRAEPAASAGGTTVRVSGLDRWSRFTDARFEEPFEIAAGTNFVSAIEALAVDAWPGVPLDLGSSSFVTPSVVALEGDDRGALMQGLATALGQELYFDGGGTLVLRPIAAGSDAVDFEFSDLVVEAAKVWDVETVYNRVIATGEALEDSPPVRGVATDDNPLSPTYYFGAFGRRPRFFASQLITTEEQAQDAAAGILAGATGSSQQVDFGAVVNPAVEPGSVARIVQPSLGIDEVHVLDEVVVPLAAADTMSARTRVVEAIVE